MINQPQAAQPLLQVSGLRSGYGDVRNLWEVVLDDQMIKQAYLGL